MTVLFVVATIILFLIIDWLVLKYKKQPAIAVQPAGKQQARDYFSLRIPEGVFFSKSHTWLNLFPSGKVQIGIDDFVSRLLDSPDVILLKRTGEKIHRGDAIIQFKEHDRVLTIHSPIDGEVLSVNEELVKNPLLMKESLFSDGWGYMMKPARLSDVKQMFLGGETKTWIAQEFQRLKDFLSSFKSDGVAAPVFMQDGGLPLPGSLHHMDDIVWKRFQNEFLELHN
jgi:glycine cleavage system H protein